MRNRLLNILYIIVLAIITYKIWTLAYKAQFLEYDDNFANIILAFLISIFSNISIGLLWWKFREFIKRNQLVTITFLIVSSPLLLFICVSNYTEIFGGTLNV